MGTGAQMLVQAAGAMLASAAYIVVALAISPRLTGYTLAYGVLVAGLYLWFGRRGQRHSDALSGLASQIGQRLGDLFGALKFARATGLTSQAEAEAASLYERWRRSYVASQAYVFAMRHGFELLGLAFIAIFLFLSAAQGREGLAAGLIFLGVFYRLAPRLLAVQEGLFQARAAHSWYLTWSARLAAAEGSPELSGGDRQPILANSIELRDVCFKYAGAVVPTLTAVSMKVAAGELIGIVGPSGQGKTTLLDLLTGLLEPSSGVILIDGVDLRDVDMRRWRSMIGLVPQEPLLVHGDFTANVGCRVSWNTSQRGWQRSLATGAHGYPVVNVNVSRSPVRSTAIPRYSSSMNRRVHLTASRRRRSSRRYPLSRVRVPPS
jgi:ATP-binding cassette subfamily C protein